MQINAIPNPITIPDSLAKSLRWPLDSAWKTITQNFKVTSITGSVHGGLDIDTPINPVPVYSAGNGKVVRTYTDGRSMPGLESDDSYGGYGNSVDVDHGNGLITRYGHLTDVDVIVGQTLTAGQQIGDSGDTGVAEGTHLHFETIYNGTRVDPNVILGGSGNVESSPWDKFVAELKKAHDEHVGDIEALIDAVWKALQNTDTTKFSGEQATLAKALGTATSAIRENLNAATTDVFLRALNAIINFTGDPPWENLDPTGWIKTIIDNAGTIGGTVVVFIIGAGMILIGILGLIGSTPVGPPLGDAIQAIPQARAARAASKVVS